MSLKVWIKAARLRTLPLAVAGIITGNLMALTEQGHINSFVMTMSIITAVLLQILSNYANDYGDFVNGADSDERTDRVMASGELSIVKMKSAIAVLAGLAFVSGVILLLAGIGISGKVFWIFLILGIGGIVAAYFYTAGKKPYGYMGLGDIAVFVFFGPVSVAGAYYLQTHTTYSLVWWVAIAVGLMSTGVLNVNNMRDIESDKSRHKMTIPVLLGYETSWYYQLGLLTMAIACFCTYVFSYWRHPLQLMFLIFFPLIIKHLQQLRKAERTNRIPFNKQLKVLSLLTLFLSIAFCISQYIVR